MENDFDSRLRFCFMEKIDITKDELIFYFQHFDRKWM